MTRFDPVELPDRLWYRIAAEDAARVRDLAKSYGIAHGTLSRCMVEYCLDDPEGFLAALKSRLRRPYRRQRRRGPRIKRAP